MNTEAEQGTLRIGGTSFGAGMAAPGAREIVNADFLAVIAPPLQHGSPSVLSGITSALRD